MISKFGVASRARVENTSDGVPGRTEGAARSSDQPPIATLHWSAPAPGSVAGPGEPKAAAGGSRALDDSWVPAPFPAAGALVSFLGDTQLSRIVGGHAGLASEVIVHSPTVPGAQRPGAHEPDACGPGGPRTGAAVLQAASDMFIEGPPVV